MKNNSMKLEDRIIEDMNNYFNQLNEVYKKNEKTLNAENFYTLYSTSNLVDYFVMSNDYRQYDQKEILNVFSNETIQVILEEHIKNVIQLLKLNKNYEIKKNDPHFYAHDYGEVGNYGNIIGKVNLIEIKDNKYSNKQLSCKDLEKILNENMPIMHWILTHKLIYQAKKSILEDISKTYKKDKLSNPEIQEKALSMFNKLEQIWLNNYANAYKHDPVQTTESSTIEATIHSKNIFANKYENYDLYVEQEGKFIKSLEYKDTFYLIAPRNLDLNAMHVTKSMFEKWNEIYERTKVNLISNFPERTEKELVSALSKAFKGSFNLHKIQEFLIKKQNDEAMEFNNYLMKTLPDFSKKFKLEGTTKEILFPDEFFVKKQLITEISLDLNDFKRITGFSRENVKVLLSEIELFQPRNPETEVHIKVETGKINFVLVFNNIPQIENKDEFVNYISLKMYKKILSMLEIFKNEGLFEKLENNESIYGFIKKNEKDFRLNAEFDVVNTWIREDRLLEEIRMEEEKNKTNRVAAIKKKI